MNGNDAPAINATTAPPVTPGIGKRAAPRMPPTILVESLTSAADAFDATDLARLTPESLRPSAEQLIVVGFAEVSDVQAAATRLDTEVVARVDRTRIGSGQRGGLPWMIFSPVGGRPKVVELQGQFRPMSRDLKRVVPRQLSEDVFTSSYSLLGKVNPGRVNGGEYTTNCVLAAIATDLTLEEQGVRGDADDGTWYFAAPPETQRSREHLSNYRGQDPVEVAGYYSIVNAVLTAGPGARGIVVVSVGGKKFDHAFNVVHDDVNGVVFLDGQAGRQATLPANFQSMQFLPTSDHFPHDAIDPSPTPGRHNALLGGYGPEFERFWQVILPLKNDEEAEDYWKEVLVRNPRHDIRIEVELKHYFLGVDGNLYLNQETAEDAGIEDGGLVFAAIIEDVAGPLRTLDGEIGYPPVDAVFDETQKTEDELERRFGDGRGSPVPLSEIFRPEDGYELTPLGHESLIGPPVIGESTGMHVHHSQGVPLAGLAEILDRIREGSYPERATGAVNRDVMADGQMFGKELAGRFVRWWADKEQRHVAPTLDAETLAEHFLPIPKVRALWGVAALAYTHSASMATAYIKEAGNLKRNFDVMSRNELSVILDGLEQDVRDYLTSDMDYALDSFRRHYETRTPDWREHYYDPGNPSWRPPAETAILDRRIPQLEKDTETIGNYLRTALLPGHAPRVGQSDAFIMTTLKELDNHSGRLRIPQAVIEIRHYGAERVGVETARQQHKELADIARREYAKVLEWESSPSRSEELEALWRSVQPSEQWLAVIPRERSGTSQPRPDTHTLQQIDDALLDWQAYAGRYATEPVLELQKLLAAEQATGIFQRSHGESLGSQSVRGLEREIKHRRSIVENWVRTHFQQIDPELAPYAKRVPTAPIGSLPDLTQALIAPRDQLRRLPEDSVREYFRTADLAFEALRDIQSMGVFVGSGVHDSQIQDLVDQDRARHGKQIYPELSHYLGRRDRQTLEDRATTPAQRQAYYVTIHGKRIWVDRDPTDNESSAERLTAFTEALGLFLDQGYVLPDDLKLFLPKYGRRLAIDDQLNIDINHADSTYAGVVLPNAMVIYPDVGASLDHSVASRYEKPVIGAIIRDLFHIWHAHVSPAKFVDLQWTDFVDGVKAVIAEYVSPHAATNPREAVAEIATAIMNGATLEIEVLFVLEALIRHR